MFHVKRLAFLLVLLVPLAGCGWLTAPPLSENQKAELAAISDQVAGLRSVESPLQRYERAQDGILVMQERIRSLPDSALTPEIKDAAAFLRVVERKARAARERMVFAAYASPPDPVALKAAQDDALAMLALMERTLADAVKELQ